MNENLIFISYRRSDSSPYSLALRLEIERNIKDANVFLDTHSIRAGVQWPEYIQNALDSARVVVMVIGPLWLGLNDQGSRRIDDPEDWVRREAAYVLQKKPGCLFPVLLDKSAPLKVNDLPETIAALASIQPDRLGAETWGQDIETILRGICSRYGYSQRSKTSRYPVPDPQKARTLPVEWTRLREDLVQYMPHWSVEFSDDPSIVDHKAIEITRSFEFSSFEAAIAFMNAVSKHATRVDHHPRWMNLWKTVTVWLCTWDAGRRVTELDIQFAKVVDRLYKEFQRKNVSEKD